MNSDYTRQGHNGAYQLEVLVRGPGMISFVEIDGVVWHVEWREGRYIMIGRQEAPEV
jgi:hypothetical protein